MQRFRSGPWIVVLLAAPALLAPRLARADEPPALPIWQPAQPLPAQPFPAQPFPAQPLPPPPYAPPAHWSPPDQEHSRPANWYGWQTLVAVAPFDIAMYSGVPQLGNNAASNAAFAVGFAGRNLAPAVVHMAHGRVGTAFASIGLHAAATATGVAVGYGIGLALQGACPPRSPCRNGFRDLPPGPLYGAIAGSTSGTVLDTVFFTYRQKLTWTASAPVTTRRTMTAWAIAPYVAPSSGGIAAAGTF